jgi:hypothetical protein
VVATFNQSLYIYLFKAKIETKAENDYSFILIRTISHLSVQKYIGAFVLQFGEPRSASSPQLVLVFDILPRAWITSIAYY